MDNLRNVATLLGIATGREAMTSLGLVASVEKGLPVAAFRRVFEAVAPNEPAFRERVIPRSTLSRKMKMKYSRLSPLEGDVVARVAGVWMQTLGVWKTEEAARAFLLRPHPVLEGRRPLDLILTTEGARLVEGILGRLQYGSAA